METIQEKIQKLQQIKDNVTDESIKKSLDARIKALKDNKTVVK